MAVYVGIRIISIYYIMALVFVALAIIPIGNNSIVLTKLIAEIWECGNKSKGARNTSGQMIIQVLNQPPGSRIYLEKTKVTLTEIIPQTVSSKHPFAFSSYQTDFLVQLWSTLLQQCSCVPRCQQFFMIETMTKTTKLELLIKLYKYFELREITFSGTAADSRNKMSQVSLISLCKLIF